MSWDPLKADNRVRITGEDEEDDNALLRRVAEGDERAFARLMARHGRAMLALAQRVVGNPSVADDVMQDVFLRVWRMAPRWRADGGAEFSTWLYRVVLNRSIDSYRRQKTRELETGLDDLEEMADSAPGSLDMVLEREKQEAVRAALNEVPERQRAALAAYYFGGGSAAQTAAVLGVTPSAAESLLTRGRKALRKALRRRQIMVRGEPT